jgi:hypothetical protein
MAVEAVKLSTEHDSVRVFEVPVAIARTLEQRNDIVAFPTTLRIRSRWPFN